MDIIKSFFKEFFSNGCLIPTVILVSLILFTVFDNSKSEYENDNKYFENPYSQTSIDHDCSDFDTQRDAQLFFEANGGPSSNPHDLDRDGDGMACDWNP
ncbi:excalibur calcium-binding domain-containing protein [Lysinibacillus xylanilyticus]|uniref:excalibur calcium-binding domain-containing protein n=1 Tax=Lysinibacillus xylanilyticus TaxID=582475 RepID=UPI003D0018BA